MGSSVQAGKYSVTMQRWQTRGVRWKKEDVSWESIFRVGDFDGDGKDDLAQTEWFQDPTGVDVFRSKGNEFTIEQWKSSAGLESNHREKLLLVGDFDGNGRDEFANFNESHSNANIYVFRSPGNSNSFGIGQQWAFSQGGYWTQQQWVVGDFNGDGKDDLAKPFDNRNGLANIDVHLSGGYYFTMERWANAQGGFSDSQKWLAGDFNGDGKDDMAKVFNDYGLASIDVHLSSGKGFTMERWTTGEGGFWHGQKWLVGDFNGDGKDDMGKAFSDGGLATIDFHISSGKGFTMQRAVTRQGTFSADQQWLVGDFNGDGKDEFTKAFNDRGFASVDVYI